MAGLRRGLDHPRLLPVRQLGLQLHRPLAAGILGWLIIERIRDGKPTSIGAASGALAGLVAITPACNILTPGWAIVLGILTGAICALAVNLKFRLGFDDSLDTSD